MNELKNKSTILIIVALFVVCTGSFLGVRAVNKNLDGEPAASQSTYVPDSSTTTEPTSKTTTTEAPSVNVNATVPSSNTITTFPGVVGTSSADITTALPGTLPTTFTTTLPTTHTTAPVLTLPTTTIPTTTGSTVESTTVPTTAASTTAGSTDKSTTATSSNAGASTSAGQPTTGQNSAMFQNGLAGYKFDADGNYYFTADDPWQRNFGYTQAFDTAAPFVSIYMDTMRTKFRYKNKDWMIQFWKGQYGLAFVGSEIGVYTKPLDRTVEYYDAASNEDALYMSCTCYRDGAPIFSREYGKYWWCTGFIPGQLDEFSDRSELALKCRITLKDEEMLGLFVNALKSEPNNLVEGRHFAVNGLDVFITWQ